jgi:hypothetical protein
MARSRRKRPCCGICKCDSEKRDKQLANRRLRKRVRQILAVTDIALLEEDFDEVEAEHDLLLPEIRDVSSVWSFGKDGKMWFGFDADYGPKLMRK